MLVTERDIPRRKFSRSTEIGRIADAAVRSHRQNLFNRELGFVPQIHSVGQIFPLVRKRIERQQLGRIILVARVSESENICGASAR